MANGLERESGYTMFSDEDLKDVSGLKKVADFVEVTCGCTSHRYGDAVGRLRVFVNGYLEITCECTPGCQEGLSLFYILSGDEVLIYMHADSLCARSIWRSYFYVDEHHYSCLICLGLTVCNGDYATRRLIHTVEVYVDLSDRIHANLILNERVMLLRRCRKSLLYMKSGSKIWFAN